MNLLLKTKTGILFCFKLLTLFTLSIVIIIRTYAGRLVTKPRPKRILLSLAENNQMGYPNTFFIHEISKDSEDMLFAVNSLRSPILM